MIWGITNVSSKKILHTKLRNNTLRLEGAYFNYKKSLRFIKGFTKRLL